MRLAVKTKMVKEEIQEIIDLCMKEMGGKDMIKSMTPEQLILMQKSMNVYDDALALMVDQAKMIDDLTEKLDLVLEKLDKLSK